MKEQFSLTYACPYCKAPLDVEKDLVVNGEIREGMMWCSNDQKQFPVRKGIPRLVIDLGAYEPVTEEVEERGERVVIIDPEHYKELPYKSLKNKQEWELRKVNFETLMKHLREDNRKRILDLGSGSCWLSNKLADYYEVFALDINSGPTGLEISDIYFEDGKYFERVQGEITNLPIADKSMDVVILSAALSEYTPGVVIGEITRVLKEDGIMYIFDSKVYNTQEGAERAIDGEGSFYPLFKKDLDKELRNMYDIKYFFPNYGRWWGMSKYITSLVTRKEYPSYPIIRAQKR